MPFLLKLEHSGTTTIWFFHGWHARYLRDANFNGTVIYNPVKEVYRGVNRIHYRVANGCTGCIFLLDLHLVSQLERLCCCWEGLLQALLNLFCNMHLLFLLLFLHEFKFLPLELRVKFVGLQSDVSWFRKLKLSNFFVDFFQC